MRAVRVRSVELTDGVDFAGAPRLLGFVKTKARKKSEVILRLDSGEPLLARWQYGLGHVIAFTSDARSRWAEPWVRWSAFGTLWPQMVRDVGRRDPAVRVGSRRAPGSAGSSEDEIVYYDAVDDADPSIAEAFQSSQPPRVVVSDPDGTSQTVALEETSPGHYEARIPAQQEGLYRVASANPALQLPATGFYREIEETKPREVNIELLTADQQFDGRESVPDHGAIARRQREYGPRAPSTMAVLAGSRAAFEFRRSGLAKRPLRAIVFASRPQGSVMVSARSHAVKELRVGVDKCALARNAAEASCDIDSAEVGNC